MSCEDMGWWVMPTVASEVLKRECFTSLYSGSGDVAFPVTGILVGRQEADDDDVFCCFGCLLLFNFDLIHLIYILFTIGIQYVP